MMKNNIKFIIFFAILSIFIFSCGKAATQSSSSTSSDNSMDKDTLIVGMELQFPPFETIDQSGAPMGFSHPRLRKYSTGVTDC